MDDIVKRLRANEYDSVERLMDEAADKIEMLEKAHVQMQRELDRLYAVRSKEVCHMDKIEQNKAEIEQRIEASLDKALYQIERLKEILRESAEGDQPSTHSE